MKLKDPTHTPIGGIWYQYEDDKGNKYRVNGYGVPLKDFTVIAANHMQNNNVEVPSDLEYRIEQQICARPEMRGKCWKEAGDATKSIIHTFAKTADKVASKIGLPSPNLAKRASGCKTCGRRANNMNKASRKLFGK